MARWRSLPIIFAFLIPLLGAWPAIAQDDDDVDYQRDPATIRQDPVMVPTLERGA